MLTDDLPANLTATAPGDMVYVPYSGRVLARMLVLARRQGWEYTVTPHYWGVLLHCNKSPLGGQDEA